MAQGFVNGTNISIPFPLPVGSGGTGVTSSTGTGSVVLSNSPTLVTPTLGIATATSIDFNPTTGGIRGITDGSSAATGIVGEIITSGFINISLAVSAYTNLTSIILTPGDWNLWGLFSTAPAVNVTQSFVAAGISTVSGTLPQTPVSTATNALFQLATTIQTGVPVIGNTGILPVNITSPTTYYFVVAVSFSPVGACNMVGTLMARRMR